MSIAGIKDLKFLFDHDDGFYSSTGLRTSEIKFLSPGLMLSVKLI